MTVPVLPPALDSLSEIQRTIGGREPVFFLDFDGTMAPIAPRPELAEIPGPVKETLAELSGSHVVCVVSGRGLPDLRRKVGLPDLYYAGDHGYRIAGPAGSGVELEVAGPQESMELENASYELERRLRSIPGVVVEAKGVSLAVHYRLVAEDRRGMVHQVVQEVAESVPSLHLTAGKLVHELRPRLPWDKGRAVLWLLGQLRLRREEVCPICVGDDVTDEDMFVAVRRWGVSVIVGEFARPTGASYCLADSGQVLSFLQSFVSRNGD